MARPKRGAEGCEKANSRWRETMYEKYGGEEGVHERMREMGRLGGQRSRTGGFASDVVGADGLTGRQRAKIAGAVGGSKSRRTGVKNGFGKAATKDIEDIEKILEAERDAGDK